MMVTIIQTEIFNIRMWLNQLIDLIHTFYCQSYRNSDEFAFLFSMTVQ